MATYTESQKASALAYLDAVKGNNAKAARDCKIPRQTLANWAKGRHISEDVPKVCQLKKNELADKLEEFAHLLLDAAVDKVEEANLQSAMTGVGIAVDKMQLLRNKPTSITDDLSSISDAELDSRIAALERGAVQTPQDQAGGGGEASESSDTG